ncbi:ARM repeat-containing protein, partial [Aureobasidium melanogenum]
MERQRKRELRDLNQRAWAGETNVLPVQGSLDSSMKKNTAFIKRLRTAINAAGQAVFLQEICTLSLHKYLSEIISACFEGLTKLKTPGEIAAGVEIVSALHQRFGPDEFTKMLGWFVGRGLATPDRAQLKALAQDVREREEKERISRQRILLRVATELWLVGVLRSLEDIARPEEANKLKESGKPAETQPKAKTTRSDSADPEPFPLEVLKDMLGHDREHVNLPLVVIFVKSFAWDILASKSAQDGRKTVAEDGSTATTNATDEVEGDANGTQDPPLCVPDMQQRFKNILSRYFQDVKAHIIRDQKHLSAQGRRNAEAYVKSGEVFEDRQTNFEKLTKSHEKLVSNAQILADALGEEMPDLSEKESNSAGGDGGIGLVKTGEYLRGQGEGAGIWEDEEERRFYENLIDLKDRVPGILLEDGKKKKPDGDDQVGKRVDEASEVKDKTEGAEPKAAEGDDQSTAIANKTVVCYRLLLLELQGFSEPLGKGYSGHPQRQDRSVASSSEVYNGASRRISSDKSVWSTSDILPSSPTWTISHNCGRYLLRNPDTSPRMASFLETLQRKKGAQHLGQQERMLIENAMYYVNPPERAAIQQKERTPLELYVRKLIYLDLSKRSLEKVIKQIRKLHWEEPEVPELLRKIFTKPGKIKYSNIHLLAVIIGALHRYHQNFTVSVLDDILEQITVGLETNDFKQNQKRIAEVKYLGELYVYRMVDSALIFDTLYHIVNCGHPGGFARPGSYNMLDLPDDYFRIRLVASLLETCGMYFDKGAVKKKLDFFLSFFQYYIQTKEPMPMDVEFVVQDMFALLRPQWKIATTFEEAQQVFSDAVKHNYQTTGPNKQQEEQEEEEEEDGRGIDDVNNDDGEDDKSSGDEAAEPTDDEAAAETPEEDSEEEEEHIIVTRPEDQRDPEADAEFDRELAKMMADSVESRKFDRKPVFDVPLPMRKTATATSTPNSEPSQPVEAPSNTMKFALLSRKGNKPQARLLTHLSTRSIDLPSDSNFAVAMRSQQEQARAEQQRIKNLVLNYDLRDEDPNDGESSFHYVLQHNTNRTVLVGKGALNHPLLPRDSNNPVIAKTSNTLRSSSHGNINTAHGLSLHSPSPPSAITSSYVCTRDNENTKPRLSTSTTSANSSSSTPTAALDAQSPYNQPRIDKSGTSRNVTRSRKLQLSDVDWYAKPSSNPHTPSQKEKPETQLSLESYIVTSKGQKKTSGKKNKGSDALGNS